MMLGKVPSERIDAWGSTLGEGYDQGKGMGITLGRLRPDPIYDYKFVCLSHNTVRGAAGGAVLTAELLAAEGYITAR